MRVAVRASTTTPTNYIKHTRSTLLFTNIILALVGTAILLYSAVAYIEYEKAIKPPPSPTIVTTRRLLFNTAETPQPWFVEATALAGGLTVFTALLGIMAGCFPNVWTVNTYSFSLSALITGQLGMLFAILVDKSWQTWPPDPSGEYDKVLRRSEHLSATNPPL